MHRELCPKTVHSAYGNTYERQACNGQEHGPAAGAVGRMTNCESSVSGYTGICDLSGNAYEWEDSCDGKTGSGDSCRVRGGSFKNSSCGDSSSCSYLRCDNHDNSFRNESWSVFGFRCARSDKRRYGERELGQHQWLAAARLAAQNTRQHEQDGAEQEPEGSA